MTIFIIYSKRVTRVCCQKMWTILHAKYRGITSRQLSAAYDDYRRYSMFNISISNAAALRCSKKTTTQTMNIYADSKLTLPLE